MRAIGNQEAAGLFRRCRRTARVSVVAVWRVAVWRVAVVALVWVTASCAAGLPYVWVDNLDSDATMPEPYRIHANDELNVLVWNQTNLSAGVRVRPDGMVTIPLIGDVAVAGLTAEGASKQVARRLDGLVVDPKVTVNLVSTRAATYSVIGEVNTAGAYPLNDGDGVLQAIAAAGGLGQFADDDDIYVLRRDPELMRIRFSYDELVRAAGNGVLFRLRDGDVVVAQ